MISKEDIREIVREELEKFKADIAQIAAAILQMYKKSD